MEKSFTRQAAACVVAALSSIVVSSCISSKYEMSEEKLNTQVTLFQEGFSLPIGKTAEVTLNDLYSKLDPQMQEIFKNNGKGYGVYYSGELDFTDSLESVNKIPALKKMDVSKKFSFGLSGIDYKDAGVLARALKSQVVLDDFDVAIQETVTLDGFNLWSLPKMVTSVDKVYLKDVYLDLEVDASSLVKVSRDVGVNLNLDVKFPQIVKLENAGEGNTVKLNGKLGENGRIVLPPVHILAFDMNGVALKDGKLDLGVQEVVIKGSMSLSNMSVDISALDDKFEIRLNGHLSSMNKEIIEIEKVDAKIDYQLESANESFSFDEMRGGIFENLDFNLDLNRYYIDMDIKTNLSVPIEADLSIIPYVDGRPDMARSLTLDEPVKIKSSPVPSDTTYTRIRISNTEADKTPDRRHVVLDLLSLLNDLPDSLQFCLNAGTEKGAPVTIFTSADYILKADYSLEVPFELGEDFALEYADTLAISSDYSSLLTEILSTGSFNFAGIVTNSLPLEIEMTLIPLDSKGNPLTLKEGAGVQVIKRGNPDGTPVQTEMNLGMDIKKEGEDTEISSVIVRFAVTSGGMPGVFFDSSCIQADLRLLIPEGITVDLKNVGHHGDDVQVNK